MNARSAERTTGSFNRSCPGALHGLRPFRGSLGSLPQTLGSAAGPSRFPEPRLEHGGTIALLIRNSACRRRPRHSRGSDQPLQVVGRSRTPLRDRRQVWESPASAAALTASALTWPERAKVEIELSSRTSPARAGSGRDPIARPVGDVHDLVPQYLKSSPHCPGDRCSTTVIWLARFCARTRPAPAPTHRSEGEDREQQVPAVTSAIGWKSARCRRELRHHVPRDRERPHRPPCRWCSRRARTSR